MITSRLRNLFFYTLGLLFLSIAALVLLPTIATAQTEPTPLPIKILTFTQPPPTAVITTPSRTPTASGSTVVQVRDKTVPGNVRASPSLDAEIIGKIKPGNYYQVLSKFGKWIEILYGQPSPDTKGWVFEDIVIISGPGSIPTAVSSEVPTANVSTASAKTTAEYLTATPGAPGTATALQLSATGVVVRNASGSTIEPTSNGPKPTFTYPPPYVEATLAPRSGFVTNQAGLPPIIPIIGLAAVGLFGLLISGLRRL